MFPVELHARRLHVLATVGVPAPQRPRPGRGPGVAHQGRRAHQFSSGEKSRRVPAPPN
jgi:hypothetical protein